MTSGTIWLAIITLAPIALIYFLGVNAAPVFLSLCLGYVLYSFDGHNALNLAHSASRADAHLNLSTIAVDLVLLLGPAVVTLISQIKSVHGSKRLLNMVPAVFCGLFAALLIVPVLPASTMHSIAQSAYWGRLSRYEAEVVGIGAGVAIIFFWLGYRHSGNKKHHHKAKP
jgi:hypothetical protein